MFPPKTILKEMHSFCFRVWWGFAEWLWAERGNKKIQKKRFSHFSAFAQSSWFLTNTIDSYWFLNHALYLLFIFHHGSIDQALYGREYLDWKRQTLGAQVFTQLIISSHLWKYESMWMSNHTNLWKCVPALMFFFRSPTNIHAPMIQSTWVKNYNNCRFPKLDFQSMDFEGVGGPPWVGEPGIKWKEICSGQWFGRWGRWWGGLSMWEWRGQVYHHRRYKHHQSHHHRHHHQVEYKLEMAHGYVKKGEDARLSSSSSSFI